MLNQIKKMNTLTNQLNKLVIASSVVQGKTVVKEEPQALVNKVVHESALVKVQSLVRKFLNKNKLLIPSSEYQTKKWRQAQAWYKTGKSNECEKYQIAIIEKITRMHLLKTPERIYLDNKYELVSKRSFKKDEDGFEYTENFDGLQKVNGCHLYYNLKFVCDSGGAQTRSLREVYHFIQAQLHCLLHLNTKQKKYFINILDGDTSYQSMDKYKFLMKKDQFDTVRQFVFVGDLNQFQDWFRRFAQVDIHK